MTAVGIVVSLLSAFVFAGAETAITGMGELRIRRLIDDNVGPRGWFELWLRDPAQVLTTLLAGNTLALTAASSLATTVTLTVIEQTGMSNAWSDWFLTGVVFSVAVVLLIASEIAPKTLAKVHPEWFLPSMRVVWWFHLCTQWLTRFTTWTAMLIVRALGGSSIHGSFQVTEEQIEDMVRIGSEAGSIDENRGDMLQGVFDIADLPVRAIMTPRTQIDGVALDAGFDDVMALVRATNFSRYPVYDRTLDKIVGIYYAKDLLEFCSTDKREAFDVGTGMKEARFVPETKKAIEVLREFQLSSMHMAIVVDEHGGTSGIVTLEDVLEELVGEIYDEYDQPERAVHALGERRWRIDAAAEIRAVAGEIGFAIPDETPTYSTLGGFVVDKLGRVPTKGEELAWDGWRFLVLTADETRVVRVEVERPAAPATDGNAGQARVSTPPIGHRRPATGTFRITGQERVVVVGAADGGR